ncbi:MAG TPA: aromatic ring-hydroxylating dioxygenase subunit alpha [Terriglobales bacterium]|jgi:glycine betaine catabolism A|nr:aromatic ring-hydroxylating dioxygenase subunit alpha [Terriglobales bacterium]
MSTLQKTLPARYYTDPELFRQELDQFFGTMWFCSGRKEQIEKSGEFYMCEVAGESIVVTRDAKGELQAFFNVCRHRGTRMCTESAGTFSGRIQCPYHGWTYALDGKLIGAPHMEQEGFRREDYPLHRVHIEEWEGFVFLNLSRTPEPLSTQLADLPGKFAPWGVGDLRLYKRISYEVRANWKLIVTNYNECLHCPVLHPALSRVSDYLSGANDAPQPSYIGGSMEFRGEAETMSVDGHLRRCYLPGLSKEQQTLVLYYAIYPNLLLSLHPDYVMAHTLWPEAVDRTRVVCDWYLHPAEMAKPGFTGDDAVEFWDMTNREDWGISELSQKGISSRAYEPGPYSPQEGLPKAFDRMVLERERARRGEVSTKQAKADSSLRSE